MVVRDPDRTRSEIMEAGFQEIYQHGYQAARVDRILAGTGVTKGAFYHHFPTKRALGDAVLTEIVGEIIRERWLRPVEGSPDPLREIINVEQALVKDLQPEMPVMGCALNNLAQEMSPLDDGFRERINRIFNDWIEGLARVLARAQERGQVRQEIDVVAAARFVIASHGGMMILAKTCRCREALDGCLGQLEAYLDSLRT